MEPLPSMYFVTVEAPIGTREKTAVKEDGSVSSKLACNGSLRLMKVSSSVIEDREVNIKFDKSYILFNKFKRLIKIHSFMINKSHC